MYYLLYYMVLNIGHFCHMWRRKIETFINKCWYEQKSCAKWSFKEKRNCKKLLQWSQISEVLNAYQKWRFGGFTSKRNGSSNRLDQFEQIDGGMWKMQSWKTESKDRKLWRMIIIHVLMAERRKMHTISAMIKMK